MRSNPMIRKGFNSIEADGTAMTFKGTKNKTFLLVGITTIVAFLAFIWSANEVMLNANFNAPYMISIVGAIGGLILAITTCAKPQIAKTTSMLYAAFEGLIVGGMSMSFELYYPGIVGRTLVLTLLAVVFTLLLYKEVPTLGAKIRKGVMIATACIVGISLMGLLFSLFGANFLLWGNNIFAIGFSIVVVGIAIANLIVDYDNIAIGVQHGFPSYMEWYFAFGILVTIVWLYLEIMQLVARLANRN